MAVANTSAEREQERRTTGTRSGLVGSLRLTKTITLLPLTYVSIDSKVYKRTKCRCRWDCCQPEPFCGKSSTHRYPREHMRVGRWWTVALFLKTLPSRTACGRCQCFLRKHRYKLALCQARAPEGVAMTTSGVRIVPISTIEMLRRRVKCSHSCTLQLASECHLYKCTRGYVA